MATGSGDAVKWHGVCYGFEGERDAWPPPVVAVKSEVTARSGYDSLDASEYTDTAEVLRAKATVLMKLIQKSKRCILFTGAGLSTGAGIADYASQEQDSLSGVGSGASMSPFLAQPTLAHHVLVALCKTGHVHRWIQQNHDGLPQKAGVSQEIMNEIHGSWYAPDNPVIPMSGNLRGDLFEDMANCADTADLSLAVGTSVCGLNADRVVTEPAHRASKGEALGAVLIALQRTVHDEKATLRVFARCDDFFRVVAQVMDLQIPAPLPKGEYWQPSCLQGKSDEELVFEGLPYDAAGRLSRGSSLTLDLREDAELVITNGVHAGACGEVHRFDKETNIDCRFKLKPDNPKMKLRAWVALKLGRWWIQAAVDGTVPVLPVVNKPAVVSGEDGTMFLQGLIEEYAK
eukprot:TRINITY_DN91116_c0_g1_i1.p1 TRINITY_DN91116_c0_g1~~TRINITY_DN91116_c0_g1_i1.p1  ORF type:complete len:416 (+),score=72.64 TRINITY_DN91116_c0_g1_i1:43-1248(+)